MAARDPPDLESMWSAGGLATVSIDMALVQSHSMETTEDDIALTSNYTPLRFALSGRKSGNVVSNQARLRSLPQKDGWYVFFVTTEHDVSSMAPRDSHNRRDATFVAPDSHIPRFSVSVYRPAYVESLHVDETHTRQGYSPRLSDFSLLPRKKPLVGSEEGVSATKRFVDEISFRELG
ncbi:hypothetical protein CEK25_004151 [Fusarium fujikuroi]|nr:hypothetical protein CEK25_004151 [Fusarium fujikuroi]